MLCKQENRYSAKEVLAHPWFELCEKTEFKSINFNLESFQNYVKGNKLKRMVLTYVASRLNEEDIQNLKSEFLNIDKNNDSSISYEELKDVLKKYNLSDENIQKMYRAADTDKDGKINYTEFIASVLDEKTDLREVYLTEAFISFDKDGNHKISKDELMDILKVKEGSNKVKSIEKMINSADKNGDGQIDYQEFLDMFLYQK